MKIQINEKITLLKENFFLYMKEADLSDLQDYNYLGPVDWPLFTLREVQVALSSVATRKAPGPDGIPNLVLKILKDIWASPYTTLQRVHCVSHADIAQDTSEWQKQLLSANPGKKTIRK